MSTVSRRGVIAGAVSAISAGLLQPQADPTADALPPADQAAVESKHANVIRKYGGRLNVAQRTRAHEILTRHQRMLMRVRDFALDNGDAPATGLRLYPEKQP